jgi:hypothetical protein
MIYKSVCSPKEIAILNTSGTTAVHRCPRPCSDQYQGSQWCTCLLCVRSIIGLKRHYRVVGGLTVKQTWQLPSASRLVQKDERGLNRVPASRLFCIACHLRIPICGMLSPPGLTVIYPSE